MTPDPLPGRSRLLTLGAVLVLHMALALPLVLSSRVTAGRVAGASESSSMMITLLPSQEESSPGAPMPPKHLPAASPAEVAMPGKPSDQHGSGEVLAIVHSTMTDGDAEPIATTGSDIEQQAFRDRLLSHIERYRRYPPSAQRDGIEGVVRVEFTMTRAGLVSQAWIQQSSGSTVLDAEATASVLRAVPLPPLPDDWPEAIDVSLPIGFTLQ